MADQERNGELGRLATAVEKLRADNTEMAGDIKAIRQWTADRKPICARHELVIDRHGTEIADLRERVTRGLSLQAIIAGLISATIIALSIGIPLWLKVGAAVASLNGG